jgi:hypothetical protein
MPYGKQGDVDAYVFHLVEKEDDTREKQQVIIPGDHVLCPQVHEGYEIDPVYFLNVALVTFCDGMGIGGGTHGKKCQEYASHPEQGPLQFLQAIT